MKKIFVGFVNILLLNLFCSNDVNAWWNENWNYRKQLTFDNSQQSENLIDFPVMVKLTSNNFDFSKAKTDGSDIRFVSSNDSTQLFHEIEKWDPDDEAIIWVKVPQINSTSTTDFIYFYYGNPDATDDQSDDDVWSSDHALVYHMDQNSGLYEDSTINNNNGVVVGTLNRNIVAKVNGGIQALSGGSVGQGAICVSSCTSAVPSNLKLGTSDMTISFWINLDPSLSTSAFVFGMGYAGGGNGYRVSTTGSNSLRYRIQAGASASTVDASPVSSSAWHQVSFVRSGTTLYSYVDGALQNTATNIISSYVTEPTTVFSFAERVNVVDGALTTLGSAFVGYLDEIKISSVAKSSNYIRADYLSTNNTFLSYGEEINKPNGPTISDSVGRSNPNIYSGWVYEVMSGPKFIGNSYTLSDSDFFHGISIYIPRDISDIDLFFKVKKIDIGTLMRETDLLPPWSQGFNLVSNIYEIKALSSYNGYPVNKANKPYMLTIKYDPKLTNKTLLKQLKIAGYDNLLGRWKVLPTPNVVHVSNNTVSNTTNDFRYFSVVYPASIWRTSSGALPIVSEIQQKNLLGEKETVSDYQLIVGNQKDTIKKKPRFCFYKWCIY